VEVGGDRGRSDDEGKKFKSGKGKELAGKNKTDLVQQARKAKRAPQPHSLDPKEANKKSVVTKVEEEGRPSTASP